MSEILTPADLAAIQARWNAVCKGTLAMDDNGWEHKGVSFYALSETEDESFHVAWFRQGEDADAWLDGRSDVSLLLADRAALERRVLRLSEFYDAFTEYTRLCQAGQTGEPEIMDVWVQVNLAHEAALADDGEGAK